MAYGGGGRILWDLIKAEGYTNKWQAQVKADILLPKIGELNCPRRNNVLIEHMSDPEHMRALNLVREVFRNLGLTNTEKIFEREADLQRSEETYQDTLREFEKLQPSTTNHLQPPLLSQILYLVLRSNRREIPLAGEDESIRVQYGQPQNLPEGWRDTTQIRHDLTHQPLHISREEEYWDAIYRLHGDGPDMHRECNAVGYAGY